jgi:phosphoribosylaminoimidazole carboxylase PurE protein
MKVLVLMGSESDLQVMEACKETLESLGIPSRMTVASAHRTPGRVAELVREAERKGAQVIICGAGMAAHLAGAVAAQTVLPVIGVPLSNSPLSGMDSLLSTVQMPPGVPVATVSIGKAGARNAAVLAAQIIARSDRDVLRKLRSFRKRQSAEVEKRAERIG